MRRRSVRRNVRKSVRRNVRKSVRKSVRRNVRKSSKRSVRRNVRKINRKSVRGSSKRNVQKGGTDPATYVQHPPSAWEKMSARLKTWGRGRRGRRQATAAQPRQVVLGAEDLERCERELAMRGWLTPQEGDDLRELIRTGCMLEATGGPTDTPGVRVVQGYQPLRPLAV